MHLPVALARPPARGSLFESPGLRRRHLPCPAAANYSHLSLGRPLCEGPTRLEERMSRILLIDGEASSRLVLNNRLRDVGHEVVAAESGAKGVPQAREHPCDLILIDLG